MEKVVIMGATGAIGTALAEQCIRHGVEAVAVCRRGSGRIAGLPHSGLLRVVECNLDELNTLPDMIGETGYDTFFHLAWAGTFGSERNHMQGQLRNVQYTLDAVNAAYSLGCSKFVGAGSQAEYGRKKGKLQTDTPVFPETGYGMAKLCAGQMSRGLCEQLGMEQVWGRVLSVYGPRDNSYTMVMSVMDKLLLGEEPALSKGEQIWDYLYAADAGKAFWLLGEKGIHGKSYPIGSGSSRPLLEYVEIMRDSIDPGLPLGIGKIAYAPAQVMYLCADISELAEDTGFYPEYSFEKGIAETIAWRRSRAGQAF